MIWIKHLCSQNMQKKSYSTYQSYTWNCLLCSHFEWEFTSLISTTTRLHSEKKKYMEEVRCETSWVCTTLTSVAGWDTLWHSALKHSCSCVEDQLPEWQLRRFCRATLTTATKTLWSLLLPCYYYSNLYNVLLAIINYDLFTISIYTKISEGHLML